MEPHGGGRLIFKKFSNSTNCLISTENHPYHRFQFGGYYLWRKEEKIANVCGGLEKCDESLDLLAILLPIWGSKMVYVALRGV